MAKSYDDDDDEDITSEADVGDDETKEIEFSMTDEEINQWMTELKRLKTDKNTSVLSIDEKLQLRINYEDKLDTE
jgi:hypothetical protein